jgi:hypothetical protein
MKIFIIFLFITGGIYLFFSQKEPKIKSGFENFKQDTQKEFKEFKSKN